MIIYVLILMLSISNLLFSMSVPIKNIVTPVPIPPDVIAYIISLPDIKAVYKIIKKQKKINRSQNSDEAHNTSKTKAEKQPFLKIQQALFPCFALIQTCKQYYCADLREKIAHMSKEILCSIFPQGVALFLLPKITNMTILDSNFLDTSSILANRLLGCCYQKKPIDQTYIIKTTLFFTPDLLESIVQEPHIQDLLIKLSLRLDHNDKLKRYTIYDESNNVVISCSEAKHFLFNIEYPHFNVTIPDKEKYGQLYTKLLELCMEKVEVPKTVNNIIYEFSNNSIRSSTLIEIILNRLNYLIGPAEKKHTISRRHQVALIALFGNFFMALECLCSLKELDLSLPAVSYEGNIAQKIIDEFEKQEYPLDLFSQNSLANLRFYSQDIGNNRHFKENKEVINTLVNIFLSNLSPQDKETKSKYYEKEKEENRKRFFQKIWGGFLVTAKIAVTACSLVYTYYHITRLKDRFQGP
jgi:hypothetical protein